MSITSIGNTSSFATAQLSGLSPFTNRQSVDSDASTGGTQKTGFSRFASAISDALASLGITLDGSGGASTTDTAASTNTATATTTTGTDASSTTTADGSDDAVGAFLQSLFAALHAQSAGSTPPPSPDGDNPSQGGTTSATQATTSPVAATGNADRVGRAHHGHGGKLETDLQSLIQELSTSSTTGTTSSDATTADATANATAGTITATTTGATTTAATGTDTTLATLEKTFDALLARNGATSAGGDALQTFLQSLAQGLHGAPATGNVVSTAA